MPHYQVLLKATCVAVVEADNEEEAVDIAISDASTGDYEFVEGECEGLVEPEELERANRHANLKL